MGTVLSDSHPLDLRDRQTLANWNSTTPDSAKTCWATGLLNSIQTASENHLTMKSLFLLLLVIPAICDGRTWTDVAGRSLEAEIVRCESEAVIVSMKGKEVKLPMSRLCEADQAFARQWMEEHKEPSAAAGGAPASPPPASGGVTFDGKPLVAGGKKNVYDYPYDAEAQEVITKRWKTADTGYRIAIAVPRGFDPSKPQRVFIPFAPTNNAEQMKSGNVGAFDSYAPTCVANGWVCIAYGTNIGSTTHDADLLNAYQKIQSVWPNFRTWEFAVGGFSGGAKGCFFPCAYLLKQDCKVIGAYLSGCNEDRSDRGKDLYKTPSSGYRGIRVFMSTGNKDHYVSKTQAEAVGDSLKKHGMREQRSEWFEGGHEIHTAHFDSALKWFAEPAVK
jgi:hypothetical protein